MGSAGSTPQQHQTARTDLWPTYESKTQSRINGNKTNTETNFHTASINHHTSLGSQTVPIVRAAPLAIRVATSD